MALLQNSAQLQDVGPWLGLADTTPGRQAKLCNRTLPGAMAGGTKAELEKVEALPPHRDLDDAVQLAQRERRRHQHAPPYHRADPDQPDLDLEDCLGIRQRRAVTILRRELPRPSLHAGRLPSIPPFVPTTPEILMLSPSRPSDREAVRFGHLSSSPQPLEAPTRRAGVVNGVPGVAVTEVVLDEAEVVALVGQREAA